MSVRILGKGSIAQALQNISFSNKRVWINCAGVAHPNYMTKKNQLRELQHLDDIISKSSAYDKLIHVSTPAVLGNLSSDYSENQESSENLTDYGKFKRSCEQKLICALGQRVLIVRLFSYTSASLKKQIVFDTVRKIKVNDYKFYLDKDQKRSLVSDVDLRRMVDFTLEKDFDGVVNYTNNQSVYLTDVIKTIFQNYKIEQRPVFLKPEHLTNYKNLYSNQSTLFDHGFMCKHIGLDAVLHTLEEYENHNL